MTVKVSRCLLTTWLCIVSVSIHQAQQNKVKGSVGRSAMLPCYSHFLEEYETSFRWLKNNSSLMAGIIGKSKISVLDESFRNRIQMPANSSTGNLSLMITHLRVEDLGMYQCEASSKNQSIRYEEIFLYVTEDGVSKPIIRLLPGQNVTEQSTVTLKCAVTSGSLPITYMWYRKTSKTEKAKKINHYLQTLVLNPSRKEDNGLFFCKVSNKFSTEKSGLMEIPLSGRKQPRSIQLQRFHKDVAVQTKEEDLEHGNYWSKNIDATYATIDHTRRLPKPPANPRNTSMQFTETPSMRHQPYTNFHVTY
ncbi:V-set and immunoglobulin domain-containing protein 4-like isoform X2 [Amblyraja radiata]|uniref:V-set and immunoglobulin domain-containing protein 4-like isoform X2 n=1 Tax=Amblyraja radiata TaxID=386614 RepID=UPI00140301F7|nr:V-set and immunoglobulin domain-containing protein 4-like isoform X2 [Amblyraja radiata]